MENVVWGILVPFFGTSLGALMVLFTKKDINEKTQKILLGFASGVMIAASFWSLLAPSIELSNGRWFPAALGFSIGMMFLFFLDHIIPHLHMNNVIEGPKSKLDRNSMLFLAVTLHNIPEGMAVGVICAGFLSADANITASAVFVLSLGIAIQNFPEGAIISLPFASTGGSKGKAVWLGILSGAVEPVAAVITLVITKQIVGILPYLLAAAAGAMIFVVVDELIPEAQNGKHSDLTTVGFAFGFVIMMVLDVALG